MIPVESLIEKALLARKNSYIPYSHFAVGAALLCKDGSIFTGCNIENAAYGPTICAERTAIFKAVSEGKKAFSAIAIAGGKEEEEFPSGFAFPCGVCRQVMREFCTDDFTVYVAKSKSDYIETTLGELLPNSFGGDNLS